MSFPRASRNRIEEALASKWDGVQVEAAKVLSQWGDPSSLDALRDLLISLAAKPRRVSAVAAVQTALSPHLKPSDLNWVIDLFIHRSHASSRWILASLFHAFAPNEVRRQLTAKLAQTHGGKAERGVRVVISHAEGRLKIDKS